MYESFKPNTGTTDDPQERTSCYDCKFSVNLSILIYYIITIAITRAVYNMHYFNIYLIDK